MLIKRVPMFNVYNTILHPSLTRFEVRDGLGGVVVYSAIVDSLWENLDYHFELVDGVLH